ncbi:lipopolysaccharide biosynthesis protein [Salinimicrobium terrae]|uniref:lipopolysaccharide biosynthesis protein n=1 Tax=Salinimicrobium terrae TaxID=470866 RepID=UPI000418EDDB|nr:lipopolysaccharide biosynthesis protein [Salinimicrobium terrae]
MSLQKKAISGISWTFIEQFGSKLMSFTVQIVLARLIAPEEFGLLGMILIFNAVGTSLSDSGMSQSLVRSDKPDEEDFSTVFSINLGVSLFLYVIFWIVAPYISSFYDQPRLTNLIRVYSVVIIINSLFAIQKTRLTYNLNFKYQMKAQLPALFLAGITGILLAYLNFGVWALVYMEIVTALSLTVIYFFQTRWIPKMRINRVKLKDHFNFGYKLALSGVMSRIIANIFPMVIGKYFSAAMVGYYTRAFTMKKFPVITISNTLDKVLYPLFAKIKHNKVQLKKAYQKVQILALLVLSTIMLMLILTAHPLFGFLLGENWLPAVPYFQLLCISGIFYPINKYNSILLKIKGRTDLYLKMAVIVNVTLVLGIIFTAKHGIIPLILAQLGNMLIAVFLNIYYANKFINYTFKEQFTDLFKTALPGLVSFTIVFGLMEMYSVFENFSYIIQLVFSGSLFLVILILIHYLFKTRSFQELASLLKLITKGKMLSNLK